MTDTSRPNHSTPQRGDRLRDKANEFFAEKKKRSEVIFEQMQTDRTLSDAKIAKLRALRLARDDAERDAAEKPGSD